jgi:hypothetical protein
MSEAEIIHCVKRDVAAYLRACEHLLAQARALPLTAHERQIILLYTRKVIEAFL